MDQNCGLNSGVEKLHESLQYRKPSSRGYQYARLDDPATQIRVLRLLPSEERDVIRCSLSTHSIEQRPFYVAVSYEWKSHDLEAGVEIFIDNKVTRISHNLWLFFDYLRQNNQAAIAADHFRLWVDAICIHQDDLGEKMAQVSLMGRIFEQADYVFAWLGLTANVSIDVTSKFIRALAVNIDNDEQSPHNNFQALLPRWGKDGQSEKLSWQEAWRSFYEMCQLSPGGGLSKKSSLQETCLCCTTGKKLNGSNGRTCLRALIPGCRATPQRSSLLTSRSNATCFVKFHRPSLGKSTFIVENQSYHECQLLHDRVYALLNLARERSDLSADYGRSLPDLLVYLSEAETLLSNPAWREELFIFLRLSTQYVEEESSDGLNLVSITLRHCQISHIVDKSPKTTRDLSSREWRKVRAQKRCFDTVVECFRGAGNKNLAQSFRLNLESSQHEWLTEGIPETIHNDSKSKNMCMIDYVEAEPFVHLSNGSKAAIIGRFKAGDLVLWCDGFGFGFVVRRSLPHYDMFRPVGIANLSQDFEGSDEFTLAGDVDANDWTKFRTQRMLSSPLKAISVAIGHKVPQRAEPPRDTSERVLTVNLDFSLWLALWLVFKRSISLPEDPELATQSVTYLSLPEDRELAI